jgi:hypothetical protein
VEGNSRWLLEILGKSILGRRKKGNGRELLLVSLLTVYVSFSLFSFYRLILASGLDVKWTLIKGEERSTIPAYHSRLIRRRGNLDKPRTAVMAFRKLPTSLREG